MELIIIDQNRDDRVAGTVALFPKLIPSTRIIKSGSPNLSKGRNRGIESSTGDLFFFPDDDATIPATFFERVAARFGKDEKTDFLSVPLLENESSPGEGEDVLITSKNSNSLTTASSMIYKRKVIEDTGYFDGKLGLGGEFEAAEDLDYVLRVIYNGFRGYYHRGTFVRHKNPLTRYDVGAAERAFRYNRGYGACVKKHWKRHSNRDIFRQFIIDSLRNITGMATHFLTNPGRAKYHVSSLKGKVNGFNTYH